MFHRKSRWRRGFLPPLGISFLLLPLLLSFPPEVLAGKGEKRKDLPQPVEVDRAIREDISLFTHATTNLEPKRAVEVFAEIPGLIVDLTKEEGDFVRRGALLARLDPGNRSIRLEKAKRQAENEERNFARAREMKAQSLLSEEAFERSRFALDMARIEVKEAAWALSQTRVRAPFSGIVTARLVSEGERADPGRPLFTIAEIDPLLARIYLPEQEIQNLTPHDRVELLCVTSNRRIEGRIERISPVVDPKTGTVKITIAVENPKGRLRPGTMVSITLVKERHEGVVTVPKEAIVREVRDHYLFVVEDGVARRRRVELGETQGNRVEIAQGLAAGEVVVVRGQGALRDGTRVEVVRTTAQTPGS